VDWQGLMPPRGYVALPRRWVVERTFSWLSQNRRMSKDYERLCASAEAFIYAAMIRLMVRRLACVARISKQFRKMNSRNFACSVLSEVRRFERQRGGPYAQSWRRELTNRRANR
jgi:hypothetical protein